jgi:DoxX-like protein
MKSPRQSDERREPLRDVPFQLLSRFPIARWAPIPLRLHGFAKLARGSDAFATILQAIGVPGPHFMAWSTILIEVIGGLAVILGAFVALVSLPMAAVAMFCGYVYCASAPRVQLDQADGRDCSRCAVRPAGLRN